LYSYYTEGCTEGLREGLRCVPHRRSARDGQQFTFWESALDQRAAFGPVQDAAWFRLQVPPAALQHCTPPLRWTLVASDSCSTPLLLPSLWRAARTHGV
jgi:hypothetical protein